MEAQKLAWKKTGLLKDEIGVRMKNFNIMWVHRKIQFLGKGFTKNQYIEWKCLKGGRGGGRVGQFPNLSDGWQKKGWCF